MSVFLTVLLAGIVTDNIVLSKLLGIEESDSVGGMKELAKKGGLLTALLLLSTAVAYPIVKFLLLPLGLNYLVSLVSALVICGILSALFLFSKKYLPKLYGFLSENASVLTCSSVVLGVCLLGFQNEYVTGYPMALVYSIASGIGFTLVSLIFFAIRESMKTAELPYFVRGLPLTLVTAALLSMAFGGFA